MSWQGKVAGGFGLVDVIFANHPLDKQRALDAIKEAKAAGASRDDFEKEMVWYIYKNVTAPGALQDHIAKQVATLCQLW
jgi:hypothetical protein